MLLLSYLNLPTFDEAAKADLALVTSSSAETILLRHKDRSTTSILYLLMHKERMWLSFVLRTLVFFVFILNPAFFARQQKQWIASAEDQKAVLNTFFWGRLDFGICSFIDSIRYHYSIKKRVLSFIAEEKITNFHSKHYVFMQEPIY